MEMTSSVMEQYEDRYFVQETNSSSILIEYMKPLNSILLVSLYKSSGTIEVEVT